MKNMYRCAVNVAGVTVAFYNAYPIRVFDKFKSFITMSDKEDYTVELCEVKELPSADATLMYAGVSFDVYEDKNGQYVRCFRNAIKDDVIYAVGRYDWNNKKICISYLPIGREVFCQIDNCIFHSAWETLLLKEKRVITHAACVSTEAGGILFSGPSGIGKSTQADLWCRYADAVLLNGDRPIVYRNKEEWVVSGSPYAGSSNCHKNESCNICAIVMLKQSDKCKVQKLRMLDAFRQIFSGLTVNSWDKSCVDEITDLVISLIKDVPVYEFECTADKDSVSFLQKEIMKGVL